MSRRPHSGLDGMGGYDDYSYHRRQSSPLERIKDSVAGVVDGLIDLLPHRREARSYRYDGWGSDYDSGRIPRRGSVNPVTIGARVVIAGAVAASVATAWFNRDQIVDAVTQFSQYAGDMFSPDPTSTPATETPATPTPAATATPTPVPTSESPPPITLAYNLFGVKVDYDDNGLPISYDINGQTYEADQSAIIHSRQQAKELGYPQLITVIESPNNFEATPTPAPTTDRPEVLEMPADTLTEAELSARGITIIQGEDVTLSLRQSAFLPGQSLDTFLPEAGNQMTIVLVDGPVVSASYMQDPKYDSVRHLVSELDLDIENYRQKQILAWQSTEAEAIGQYHKSLAQGSTADIENDAYEVIHAQARLQQYQNASAGDLAVEAYNVGTAGYYVSRTRTVFIAVGGLGESYSTEAYVYVNPDGSFSTAINTHLSRGLSYVPSQSSSFPRPSDFRYLGSDSPPTSFPGQMTAEELDSSPFSPPDDHMEKYPYGGQEASQVFRHEIKHDEKISAHPTTNSRYNSSEWWTDMQAMGGIDEAYRRFAESGFTDNSLYWAVFQVNGHIYLGEELPTPKSFWEH